MVLGILAATVGVARMVIRTFAQASHPSSEQASTERSEAAPSEEASPSETEETD